MAKRRAAQNAVILPWLSAKPDCKEGRFLQVGNSLLLSKVFQELSTGARQLYLCMTLESAGHRQFEFPKSAAKKYGFPESSFKRHLVELKNKDFIICTENNQTIRQPNVYEFCFEWKTHKD